MSTFVLNGMVELVNSGLDVDKGIKEQHLKENATSVLLFSSTKVNTSQV